MAPTQNRKMTTTQQKRNLRTIANRLVKLYPVSENDHAGTLPFVDTLIAIILSQNTSDVNSHRAYQALRTTWPRWEEVAALDPEEIEPVIAVSGLAAQKSRTISATLGKLLEEWDDLKLEGIDEVDDETLIGTLTSVKGVGLKSATCAMMFALDRDLCAVDTHLHRVLNRLGVVATTSPDKTFEALRPILPKGRARAIHVALIHFGRNICKARLPHCFECPLYDRCGWSEKEEHARASRPGPKPVSGTFLITDGIGD